MSTGKNPTYCKNCQNILIDNYCGKCGQRSSVNKITFKETFHDFMDTVFSVNAPLWTTLKMLIKNPGKLFREYLSGKRKSYYKPVAFFILMTVIYLLIRAAINFDPFSNSTITVEDNSEGKLLIGAKNFFLINIDKLLFVFVFSLGLFLKLFFLKKYSLAEFLAIAFYLMGIYTLITTLNMFYIQYLDSGFQFLAILVMWGYFIYAMISFFQKKKVLVFLKALLIFFLAFYLYFVLAFSISYLIVWINGN
jgi:hypothetical protein